MGEKLMAHIEAIGGAMSTTEMLRGRTIGKVVSTVTKSLRVVKNIQYNHRRSMLKIAYTDAITFTLIKFYITAGA